jgi:catechol 2,3-dioxygenase-like lactoylglutathione lyase family enzyme
VLVLSPFGGRSRHPREWGTQLAAQVDELRAGGSRVETIVPDSDSEHMFGANAMDPSLRPPAARAGYDQGRALAEQLRQLWLSGKLRSATEMALKLDTVGIVVEDLAAAIEFFRELGLELEGQATVEGEWAGRVTGLGDQRDEIAMMRTPDGHGRLELSRFLAPDVVADHRNAPVNALGYLRVMFAVDDIDETLVRLRKHGARLVSTDVIQYEDVYRLCYVRGPEGILIGLAQELHRA